MQGVRKRTSRRAKAGACAGFLVLAALLSIAGGCATSGREKTSDAQEPAAVKRPSKVPAVARPGDGREGFVITEFPSMDEALRRDFHRAVVLLDVENYDQAIGLLEKVIEKSPGVTGPYIDIAIAYRRTGRLEQAEENLKTALELFPGHPVASNEYGLLFRETGRFGEARAMYENTIGFFPEYYPAHRNLGILCDLYLDDLQCALDHYEIYAEARPYDEQVKLWVADLRARLGRE